MTILWIYNLPLIPEAGGTERITSLIAKGLSQRGHKCLGILEFKEGSTQMVYEGHNVEDLYEFLKENKVDVIINQIAYSRWLLRDFLERGGAKWHAEGGKIISCLHFDPCNPSYIQLLRSAERLTFRQYVSLVKQYVLMPYYKNRQRQNEGSIYNYIYQHSDALIILSSSHIAYLMKVMQRQEYSKIQAIGNALTFPEIAKESIVDHKNKTVLVCSRMLEYHKRITLILRAWNIVKQKSTAHEWRLVIVGDGPDLPRYKKQVSDKGIKDVEFVGQQNPAEYYEKSSILLVASSAEGWGLNITEGLQYGVVPVVMESSSVYKEMIDSMKNVILTPNNNVKAFSNAILMLMSDPKRLRAMQLNALHSATRFTLDRTINKWQNLLEKLSQLN